MISHAFSETISAVKRSSATGDNPEFFGGDPHPDVKNSYTDKPPDTGAVLLVACSLTAANAARVLGILTIPAKSHFSCNYAILQSLHAAGHHVTMISPFPPEKETENFTHIALQVDDLDFVGQSTISEWADMSVSEFMITVNSWSATFCHSVMELPEIQNALKSSQKRYDVLLAEFLGDFPCLQLIAQKLGIPIIGTLTLRSLRLTDQAVGVPNSPAVEPLVESGIPALPMNLMERVENLWYCLTVDYYWPRIRDNVLDIGRKYVADEFLQPKDVSLIFYNSHASLAPRTYVPNVIDVGGIHFKPAKSLPEDIRKFIDEALHGVILFTLGSVVKAESMSDERRQAFLDAFASIPQRVIWKFEKPIKNAPKNVMIASWLPQRDILEHKNVIAFMSHCGLSGVYEAVMTGTPVVTIPLFNDQPANAALLCYRGAGIYLNFRAVTKEKVLAALDTIVNDTSYRTKMQELSRTFKDRPMSPQETVVYWTEYVIRHNGAPHLKALGTDMPLYQYFMLDIIAIAVSALSFSVFVICLVLKRILRIMRFNQTGSAKKDE